MSDFAGLASADLDGRVEVYASERFPFGRETTSGGIFRSAIWFSVADAIRLRDDLTKVIPQIQSGEARRQQVDYSNAQGCEPFVSDQVYSDNSGLSIELVEAIR